jgi:hypothetical protein
LPTPKPVTATNSSEDMPHEIREGLGSSKGGLPNGDDHCLLRLAIPLNRDGQ